MKAVIWLRVAAGLAWSDAYHRRCVRERRSGAAGDCGDCDEGESICGDGCVATYWDYFFGYGLFVTVSFAVQAVVFWQLGELAKTHAALTRPMVAAFFVAYLATSVVSGRYFFSAPMVMELMIAACLSVAFVAARERQA